MTTAKAVDDRCLTCRHHFEAHKKGLCDRCIGGKMLHPYKGPDARTAVPA